MNPTEPDTIDARLPSRAMRPWLRALSLVLVLLVCASLRIWLIDHAEIIEPDGVVYTRAAQAWAISPGEMLHRRRYDVHPGYPALVTWTCHRLASVVFAADPVRWELAGRLVSLVAGLMAMGALWVFARRAFDDGVALVTVLLFGLGRKWAVLGAAVLTDAVALCLALWALVLAMIAAEWLGKRALGRAAVTAAAVGLLAAAAYLVRPEGMFIILPAIALWIYCARRAKAGWKATALVCVIALLVMAAGMAPYVAAIGTLNRRWSAWLSVPAPAPGGPVLACLAVDWASAAGSVWQVVPKLMERMHPLLGALLCIWLLTWIVARLGARLPRQVRVFPSRESAVIMIGWAVVFTPLVIARNLQHPMSGRYMLLQAALLAPLAGAGVRIVVEWAVVILARLKARPQLARRIMTAVVVVPMAVGLAGHALRPIHEGDGPLKAAGLWLGENTAPESHVFVPTTQVLVYAQRPGTRLPNDAFTDRRTLRKRIADTPEVTGAPTVYLVTSDNWLAEANPDSLNWFPASQIVKTFVGVGRKADTVRIHRLP